MSAQPNESNDYIDPLVSKLGYTGPSYAAKLLPVSRDGASFLLAVEGTQ
jgi:hypothetical protein